MLTRYDADAATQRHGLETIERNSRTQARVIDDLLSASGLLGGRLRIVPQRVSLAAVMHGVVEDLAADIAAQSLHVRVTADDRTEVFGDVARLRQVCEHLLSNAVKFTPAGGHVDVSLTREQGTVALTVRDDGVGINGDFLPHVFDKFRQADGSFTREHGGLGLGLAIVRELVQMHGGSVAAHSDGRGRGASFTVHLPASGVAAVGAEASRVS